MVPENVNNGRWTDFKSPRRKINEPPARMISPLPSTSSPSRAASRNSQANDTVTPGPLQNRRGHREQAIVRERHEATAMNVAHAVEMLVLDPECAVDAPLIVHPVVEWPVKRFKIVAAPGPPALEFALCFDMQIGAVEECAFGQVVHAIRPSFEQFSP